MENQSTRASDDDRDAVVRQLSAQTAAGRLTRAEFEERMTAALHATTRGDLAPLVADLPVDLPVDPEERSPRRSRLLTDRRRLACLLAVAVLVGVAAIAAVSSAPAVAGVIAAVALCTLATAACHCRTTSHRGDR